MKNKSFTMLLVALLALAGGMLLTNNGQLTPPFQAQSAHALTLSSVSNTESVATTGSMAARKTTAPESQQGSGFTYQGSLKDGTTPANGTYDFQFTLFDALTGGTAVGGTITQTGQTVASGVFTVQLDFGQGAFNGNARWLEIAVRHAGGGSYTILTPRQPITPAPYALFALKTQGYKNVVTVAQSGGDYTSIQAALDSITDAGATNRYLLWIAPGVYAENVTMKQYVDIEGSGEKTTKITYPGFGTFETGTLIGASNAELRSLTVENTGGNTYAVAIYNGGSSPSLRNITAIVSGQTLYNWGIYNYNASPTLNSVTITASGGGYNTGIFDYVGGTATINNSTVTVTGGVFCIAVYNSAGSSIINNSSINALGASQNGKGLFGSSSTSVLNNVTVNVSGVGSNVGINTESNTVATLNNVTVNVSGNQSSQGVNSVDTTARISNSTITAGTNTIYNMRGNVQVGASNLAGGPTSGSMTCAGVYDENFVFYANTCP